MDEATSTTLESGTDTLLPPGSSAPALWQTYQLATNPLQYLERLQACHGDIFTVRLMGGRPWVCLTTREHLKAMYTASPNQLLAGEAAGSVFAPLTGWNASLTLDGDAHVERRNLLRAAFGPEAVGMYADVVRQTTLNEIGGWPMDRTFSLHPRLRKIAIGVILRAIFGIRNRDDAERVSFVVAELADRGMNSPLLFTPALRLNFGRYSPWGRILHLVRQTHTVLDREIARRKTAGPNPKHEDVLSILLECRDSAGQPLSKEQIRDELVALLLAGYETTHTAMCWVFERLLACPEAGTQVQTEVSGENGLLELLKLPALDAFIRESLRFRPVSAICGGRIVIAPFEVGKYRLPPGVIVTNCSYLLHRRNELYPEPDAFRPERFMGKAWDPYALTTFGGGDRRCMGYNLAMLEIKVVVATVLRKMRLRLADRSIRPVARGVHLIPERGLLVNKVKALSEDACA